MGQCGTFKHIADLSLELRIFFVELKTERGRTSPVQQAQIRALRKLGCEVRVLYGMQDVENFLQEIGGDER